MLHAQGQEPPSSRFGPELAAPFEAALQLGAPGFHRASPFDLGQGRQAFHVLQLTLHLHCASSLYSILDPASATWSKDARLFQDRPLERSFAPE